MGLFYLISRILSLTAAFIYPTYASYKALAKRPASEPELERWLMYWSVVGVIIGVEYVAEWAISWIPFYWTTKSLFLLWLALPQTEGSTYIYIAYLQPLLLEYEPMIDVYISQYKTKLYAIGREKLKTLWEIIVQVVQKQTGINLNAAVAASTQQSEPPTPASGESSVTASGALAGATQMGVDLWKQWGPTVVSALKPMQNREIPQRPSALQLASKSSTSSNSDYDSLLARRRQLQAELETLSHIRSPGPQSATLSQSIYLSADAVASSTSEGSSHGAGHNGQYEEINKDDIGDTSSMEEEPLSSRPPTGWFANWGRRSSGYERLKEE